MSMRLYLIDGAGKPRCARGEIEDWFARIAEVSPSAKLADRGEGDRRELEITGRDSNQGDALDDFHFVLWGGVPAGFILFRANIATELKRARTSWRVQYMRAEWMDLVRAEFKARGRA